MNYAKISGVFLCLTLGLTSYSQASILIEPVLGYSFGKSKGEIVVPIDPTANATTNDSLKGASYGGRLGYQDVGFQVGLDYLASNLSMEGGDLKTSEIGGFVGYEFPVMFRVYGGYIFSA